MRQRLEEIKALIDLGQDKDSADMEDNPSTDWEKTFQMYECINIGVDIKYTGD